MANKSSRQEGYNELLNELISLYLRMTPTEIQMILEKLKVPIGSSRVINHITDIEGVVKVLQARNVLNWSNVAILEKIADWACRPNALERIKLFKEISSTEEKEDSMSLSNRSKTVPNNTNEINSTACKTQVFQIIAENIGHDWRNLARVLGIKDNQIGDIEKRLDDSSQSMQEVLRVYQHQYPNVDHIEKIISALKNISRHKLISKILEETDVKLATQK